MFNFKNNLGFAIFISVTLIGAAALAVVLSVAYLSINSLRNSQIIYESQRALAAVNACAEKALEAIRSNNYVGTGNLSEGSYACSYNIINLGGSNRQIEVTGNAGEALIRNKIIINSINPQIIIFSWQEVADF